MKIITSKTHAIIDYIIGIIMLCIPTFMNFPDDSLVCRILVIPALLLLLTATLSEHEINLANFLSRQLHLKIDVVIAAFLLFSPIIIGLSHSFPHILFGMLILANIVLSKRNKAVDSTTFNNIQN
ncbi:hypothetical protein GV828_02790 [Flavobacterium sp. NST-5]|uniref:SPW repeat-containing protein n=1 Tax=Flavobacterium ichthyis TaxID=2698827 RepID=A0ABW9ZBF2_9FLAO|nr:hypothetical protein [Flavobacterium ichthyis]NBL64123.1 hypothetical protein [Flavobacterium ichthyis]